MAKTQFQKPARPEDKAKTGNFKKNDKFVAKLKSKLKSAIFNNKDTASESLIADAKTQKSNVKSTHSSGSTSQNNNKSKANPNAPHPNKADKAEKSANPINKNPENVNKNGNQNKNKQKFSSKQKNKNDSQASSSKPINLSGKTNGLQNAQVSSKKKRNKRKPKKSLSESTPPKLENQQKTEKNNKHKADEAAVNKDGGKKRLKVVGGFVESNADDKEQTKLVNEKLKKSNKKKSQAKKSEHGENGDHASASIKVHNVVESKMNGSGHNSDSETDSYIDKFFNDNDGDFDENRYLSLDEIEAKKSNGFLVQDSGEELTESDETSSSEPSSANKKTQVKNHSKIAPNSAKKVSNSSDTLKQLAKYKKKSGDNEYDFDEHDWPTSGEEDGDDIQYDINNLMYGTDSEISLGSELMDSDDLDDTYECESTDDESESMDEYEDDMSYDDDHDYSSNSEFDDSDCSEYSDSESGSSNDSYDDFLHSRHNDDDHSSNEDHEYTNSDDDDLRIAQGTAVTHKIDDRINLFKNDTESRIIELPKSDSDNDSCVELIPITMTRKVYQKMERKRLIQKQNQLQEQKAFEEQKQLEHQKSNEDYYNMDNQDGSINSYAETLINASVSVVKCPKGLIHPTLDWMEDRNIVKPPYNDNEMVYTKSITKKVVAISVPDYLKRETSSNKVHAKDIEMEQDSSSTSDHESNVENNIENNIESSDSDDISTIETLPPKSTEPTFFNSMNSRHVLLLLRKALHFHGSLHVKLIAGNATVFGFDLQHDKTVTLHSPRGHGLISLIPTFNVTNNLISLNPSIRNLKSLDNLKSDFYSQDINYLKESFDCETNAILLLERDHTNKGVNMIDRYMRETMFPNINAFNSESPFYSSEFVLHCKFLDEPANGLTHSEQWTSVKMTNKSKVVAIGGKGVGKSTFVRYLINSNFNEFQKFLFIDLDIGQPELFVPQTLSATVVTEAILGPGYLRNLKPAKAILFGDINVLPDPIKYLRCVSDIFKFCSTNDDFANIPWIINTMGYNRGFGSELMACILKIFKPSDLVQIQSRSQSDNFDQIMKADVVNTYKFKVFEHEMQNVDGICKHKTHLFESVKCMNNKKSVEMTAKDLRYAMILAKLGNCLKYNSDWLTSVKPFEASLNDLDVIVTSGEEINPSDYLDLLNANLVYLCEKRTGSTTDIVDCHGIGIVRSIDINTNKLYLLSTIPITELRSVNVLAIGAIPLPSAVFLNQHSQIRGAVPFVYNSDNFVGSKQVARHIFRAESKSTNKPIQLMEE